MASCEECGAMLVAVEHLGGDYCRDCHIWYAPYGYENLEVR